MTFELQNKRLVVGFVLILAIAVRANAGATSAAEAPIIFPSETNAFVLRIYTSAAPDADHLLNSFDVVVNGKTLLVGPSGEGLQKYFSSVPTNDMLSHVLIAGLGPQLAATNHATIREHASGDGWQYLALDLTRAYTPRVREYRRGFLFVAPDLIVIHDHVEPRVPATFQIQLHPPAATLLDPDWKDLRLNTTEVGLQITAPSRKILRSWEIVESSTDASFPGTLTAQLSATNKMALIDLVTVLAIQPGGLKRDHFAFKLVESNSAVGARIHRDGLPTLVAFRLAATNSEASLDTFKFSGPAGVSIFRAGKK